MLSSSNGIHLEKDESTNEAPKNSPLTVEISDAISEKENVKFTLVVKTSLSSFTESKGSEYKVKIQCLFSLSMPIRENHRRYREMFFFLQISRRLKFFHLFIQILRLSILLTSK
jgi:hypothetical protein